MFTDVIGSEFSYFKFAKKKQKWWSHTKELEHAIYEPGLEIRFLFYMRTVLSDTGTKVTHVRSATERKSDRSEFIFRLVLCKRMKRNVLRPIRTHTGLSLSQFHVNTL